MKRTLACLTVLALASAAVAEGTAPIAQSPALRRHLAQGRVVDVTVAKKQVGSRKFFMKTRGVYRPFLEGAIVGTAVEWDGKPAAGVVVRLSWDAQADPFAARDSMEVEEPLLDEDASPVEDARGGSAVTDKNGAYRLPFSVPIVRNRVELKGKISYNPEWETQLTQTGRAHEPWAAESSVELYYYKDKALLALSEGPRKALFRARQSRTQSTAPEAASPAGRKAQAKPAPEIGRAGKNALFLDLQLLLVSQRLEKHVALKNSDAGLELDLDEEGLFVPGRAELAGDMEKRLAPLARWLGSQGRSLDLQASPRRDGLEQERVAKLASLLMNQGVDSKRISSRTASASDLRGVRIVLTL
jgi:hypothetical protein